MPSILRPGSGPGLAGERPRAEMPPQPVLCEVRVTFPDRVKHAPVDLAGLVREGIRRGSLAVRRADPFAEIADDLQEQAKNGVGAQLGQLSVKSPARGAAAWRRVRAQPVREELEPAGDTRLCPAGRNVRHDAELDR